MLLYVFCYYFVILVVGFGWPCLLLRALCFVCWLFGCFVFRLLLPTRLWVLCLSSLVCWVFLATFCVACGWIGVDII